MTRGDTRGHDLFPPRSHPPRHWRGACRLTLTQLGIRDPTRTRDRLGPQPGTRFAPLRAIFRSTPLHMQHSSGPCHEARLRRTPLNAGRSLLVSRPIPGLGPRATRKRPRYGHRRTKRPAHIDEDRAPASSTGRDPHGANVAAEAFRTLEWTSTHRPLRLNPRSRTHGEQHPRPTSADQRATVGITRMHKRGRRTVGDQVPGPERPISGRFGPRPRQLGSRFARCAEAMAGSREMPARRPELEPAVRSQRRLLGRRSESRA